MKTRELMDATRQLALLVRMKYPLAQGLKKLGEESRWLATLGTPMEAGDSLAGALGRYPRLFSPFYTSMVEAAEASEAPEGVLTQLSCWLERADGIRRDLALAFLYPYVVLNAAIVTCLAFCYWLLPSLAPLLETSRSPVVELMKSGAIDSLSVFALALLVGLNLVVLFGLFRPTSGVMPGTTGLVSLAEQSLWARALGSLLATGMPLPEALECAGGTLQNPTLKKKLSALSERVKQGSSLEQALGEAEGLDPYLAWNSALGADSEKMATAMLLTADQLEERVDRARVTLLRMVEPWAMSAVGLIVLLVLASFWAPFYSAVGNFPV